MANGKKNEYLDLIEGFVGDKTILRGHMFGMPCLKVHNKVFAVEYESGIVFKLPEDSRQDALVLVAAQLWAPFSKTHVKKEWVYLQDVSEEDIRRLSKIAMSYVAQLSQKNK